MFPNLKIINQNVDGFLKGAINFHGNSKEWKCDDCRKIYSKKEVKKFEYICNECRGYLRPNIVLYNESINETNFKLAKKILLQLNTQELMSQKAKCCTIHLKNTSNSLQ